MMVLRCRGALVLAGLLSAASCIDLPASPESSEYVVTVPPLAGSGASDPAASAAPLRQESGESTYDWLIRRGRAELNRGDFVRADTTLREARAVAPDRPEAYLWLSLSARGRGDETARCQLLRQYLQLKPDNTARAYYDRELEACQTARRTDPGRL